MMNGTGDDSDIGKNKGERRQGRRMTFGSSESAASGRPAALSNPVAPRRAGCLRVLEMDLQQAR